MKADAQFLHASVKVDAEEVADALQNPNPVAEEKSENEQAADRRDAAEDASVNEDRAPICIERHVEHPRLRWRERGAIADDVEEDAREIQPDKPAEQCGQREQEQIDEMAAVRPHERPHPRDQPEDIARAQAASVGERHFACRQRKRRGDGGFSVQSMPVVFS